MEYMAKAFTFRLPEDLIERVDRARGDVNRTRWVQRALESALDNVKGSATSGQAGQLARARVDPATESSASSRAPVEKEPANHVPPVMGQRGDASQSAPSRPAKLSPAQERQARLNKAKGL